MGKWNKLRKAAGLPEKKSKTNWAKVGRLPKHIFNDLSEDDKKALKRANSKKRKISKAKKDETRLVNRIAMATAKRVKPYRKKKRRTKRWY